MSKDTTATPVLEGQLVAPDQSAVESLVKGEVDVAVVTARRFPRSVKAFMDMGASLVTLDQATAEACYYALPRREADGATKMIDGPSARFAELVASAWGNMRADARLVGVDDRFVTMRGSAWDLERNVLISYEVQRRITTSKGRRYSDDMIMVTANAAGSIALRNAVLKVIPAPFWRPLYDKARAAAAGTEKTLATSRVNAIEFFTKRGVPVEALLAHLDVKAVDDLQLNHVADLRGMATALRDGDTTLADLFPAVFKGSSENGGPREKAPEPKPQAEPQAATTTQQPATTPAAEPQPAQAPADVFHVKNVEAQLGSKTWWIVTFTDNSEAYTFSSTFAQTLAGALQVGAAVRCEFKTVEFRIPRQVKSCEVVNG